MSKEQHKHWLYRTENRRTLWIILAVLLLLAIIPEFFIVLERFSDLVSEY